MKQIVINRTQGMKVLRAVFTGERGVVLRTPLRHNFPCPKIDDIEKRKPVIKKYKLYKMGGGCGTSSSHIQEQMLSQPYDWKRDSDYNSWKRRRKCQARDMQSRDTIRNVYLEED